jgi:methylmalonyl-CoA/ethylmalonyl-CoA epimerase
MNRIICPEKTEFHHIGYATLSLQKERQNFGLLGYESEGSEFIDPIQGVTGIFLIGSGPRIELLANLPGRSTLTPWLRGSAKMYHMAWQVDDLDYTIKLAKSSGAKLAAKPAPAVAFGGRRICFIMLRNGLLAEFIERHV